MEPEVLDPEKEVAVYKPSALAKISQGLTDESVKELSEECKSLEIKDVDDKKGYQLVYDKHQIIKNHLAGVKADHKAGKVRITEASKMFDAEKKKWIDLLTPISEELKLKREIVENEKERLAEIEKQRIKEVGEKRGVELMASGAEFDGLIYHCGEEDEAKVKSKNLALLEDDVYSDLLEMAKLQQENKLLEKQALDKIQKEKEAKEEAEREAEKDKQAKIAEDNRLKEEKLKKEREEFEAQKAKDKKEQDEREAKIKAAQDKIDREKREAAEKIEDDKREEQRKKDIEEAEKVEKERLEELEKQKPDQAKIKTLIENLSAIEYPEMKSKKWKTTVEAIKTDVQNIIGRYK